LDDYRYVSFWMKQEAFNLKYKISSYNET
jgi:hypothetical protein